MQLPNLSSIYKVMSWHQTRKEPGSHVGIFALLPSDIANQFSDNLRAEEDDSPAHITVCYIGDMPLQLDDKLIRIVSEVCEKTKPFIVKIKKPRSFVNEDGQIVFHSPVSSSKLQKFHLMLKQSCLQNLISVSNKYPEYKPHITIAYLKDKRELKEYKDFCPQGEWFVKDIWIWGTKDPYLITLGK